jgi:hypothetical protein
MTEGSKRAMIDTRMVTVPRTIGSPGCRILEPGSEFPGWEGPGINYLPMHAA